MDFRAHRPHKQLSRRERALVSTHYQQFVDYHGMDLVRYPDGAALAEDLRKFYRYQIASAPPDVIAAALTKYDLSDSSPGLALPSELLKSTNDIGIYFNPTEGQELMDGFNALVSGLQKQGAPLTEDEAESFRALLSAEAISPQFEVSARIWGCRHRRSVFAPARDCSIFSGLSAATI